MTALATRPRTAEPIVDQADAHAAAAAAAQHSMCWWLTLYGATRPEGLLRAGAPKSIVARATYYAARGWRVQLGCFI